MFVSPEFDSLTSLNKLNWEQARFAPRLLWGQWPLRRRLLLPAPSGLGVSLAVPVPYWVQTADKNPREIASSGQSACMGHKSDLNGMEGK